MSAMPTPQDQREVDAAIEELRMTSEGLVTWRRDLVRVMLRTLVGVGALGVVASCINAITIKDYVWIPIYIGAYLLLVVITFWGRVRVEIQQVVIVLLLYLLGMTGLWSAGLSGDGRVFLVVFPFMLYLFFGGQWGYVGLGLSLATLIFFGVAFSSGALTVPIQIQANTADPSSWLSGTVVYLILAIVSLYSLNYVLPRFEETLSRTRRLARRLEARGDSLESAVRERTTALESRSQQLAAAAHVVREVSSIRDITVLADRTVRMVAERFDFYHVGLFLLDAENESLMLRAASSAGGQRLLAVNYQVRLGGQDIVATAALGAVCNVTDVGRDALRFSYAELPYTRSEIALPLLLPERAIGVLDVHSIHSQAFNQEDEMILQTLANQIALLINNAQLFERVQESLEAERRAYGQLGREAWKRWLAQSNRLGFTRTRQGITPVGETPDAEVGRALRSGALVRDATDESRLVLPLKVRGQVIGVLNVRKPAARGQWTQQQIDLLQVLSEQLQLALDSAQSFQDARRLADRERIISKVSANIRETLDIDEVLQRAVREMRDALGLHTVSIHLEGEREQPLAAAGREQE